MPIDSAVAELFADFGPASPGATVAAWREGELIFCRGFGSASVEHQVPNRRDTVFYIASMSKQFVACAIAMLEADGLLDIDEEVTSYLPELHPFSPPVRVRHLVHHTSGIRDEYALAAVGRLPDEIVATDAGLLDLLSRQTTLNFEPGTQYMYSNSGYFLLAQIVKRVSGQRLGDFAHKRIFEPLGMSHTLFRHDTSVVIPNRASGYRQTPDGEWRLAEYTQNAVGPGGVVTIVDDLARWSTALMNGGLSPASICARMLDRETLADGSPNGYAFGLMVDEGGRSPIISHSGGVTGFTSEMLHIPDERVTVICLANTPAVFAPAKARHVLSLVAPELSPDLPVAPAAKPGTLRPRAGIYLSSDEATIARLDRQGASWRLHLPRFWYTFTEAEAETGDAPRLPDGSTLAFGSGGFEIAPPPGAGGSRQRFLILEPGQSTSANQAGLAGEYRSDELQVSITVHATDAGMAATWPGGKVASLTWAGDDLLIAHPAPGDDEAAYDLPIRLIRDQADRVTALRISTARGVGNIFQRCPVPGSQRSA